MSNPDLREKFHPRIRAWKNVVLGGVRDAFAAAEEAGIKLPPPFTASVIATFIAEFWVGMEFADLIGGREEQVAQREALDAMEQLLERFDARTQKRTAKPRGKRRRI